MPHRVTLRVKRSSPLVHERHPIPKKKRTTHQACDNSSGSESEYEDMAQNSTGRKRAAIPLVLNKSQKRKIPSWDERFKELTEFKKINGHLKVPTKNGQLGRWVSNQRMRYRLLKDGKHSPLTIDKCEKLESIGFEFNYQKKSPWDQRFQELVNFKKINGHANVPTHSGSLGGWVSDQRRQYRLLQASKDSQLTIDNCEKLESLGFEFIYRATYLSWDQHFQELVDYKKINGHVNAPTRPGLLGRWITTQRREYGLLKEGKHSTLTTDKCEKLESIGFEFDSQRFSW